MLTKATPPLENFAAMVRLCRFYEQLGGQTNELCQTVYKIVTARPDHLCSFVDDEKTFGPTPNWCTCDGYALLLYPQ